MRIFVAGGTGAIGRPLIQQAIRRGHTVVATTRSSEKLRSLEAVGAVGVLMDGLDASGVGQAIARARPDVIVHEMTALGGKPDMRNFDQWFSLTNRLRTQGTQHLLAAAQATGVRLFVAQSYAGWPSSRGRAILTEEEPFNANPVSTQRESLAAIVQLERSVTTAPGTGIVLRYGSLYGPGASDDMVRMLRKRMLPMIGGGTGITSWVHVDDAAAATLDAIENPMAGIYNIVDDDPAPVSEWLPAMAEAVGAPQPLRIPAWVARLLAGEAAVQFMTQTSGFSNDKARRVFDWKPQWSSWREGFKRALGVAVNARAA